MSNEIVSEIIAGYGAEKPSQIVQLTGKGDVNEVYAVETKNARFIVRMNTVESLDEYEKEVWSSRQAAEKGVPVPEILKIGTYGERAFSIQRFIEGEEGRHSIFGKKYVWKKLGEYARRIHTIKVTGFGLALRDLTTGDARKSWLEYLDYNIESLNEADELLRLGIVTNDQQRLARKLFENLRIRKFAFGLNHGDLSLKNAIVDESGTVHLIDWGSAEASIVPHHDLIELLKMQMLENDPDEKAVGAFLEGYEISIVEFREIFPDLKSLLILRAFDKLRWALDHRIENMGDYIFNAKMSVEKFLE